MDEDDPRTTEGLSTGLAAGDAQSGLDDVGQICTYCPDNWVEVGAIDETAGQPIPGLPYKIFDIGTKEEVASGILDENGQSPRHHIPMANTQLFVVFGTDAAIDDAMNQIDDLQTQQALQANAVSEWRGFEAGLSRDEFDQQHWERTRNGDMIVADRGFLGQAARGAEGLGRLPGAIVEAVFGDGLETAAMYYYEPYRDEAWGQYQLATGARAASSGESLGAGVPQGITFGWDEEISAGLNSLFDDRSYEEIVDAQRQVLRQNQISNPGWYMGGEIAGAIPTIFIPVGGAAVAGARGATTAGRATLQGAGRAAPLGAGLGALSGAGHDEGGILDRLDGAAIGAATGGISAAIFGGVGVLIARGISRTRIWARFGQRAGQNRTFNFSETGSGKHLRRAVDVDGQTVQINSGHAYNRAHSGGDVRHSGLSMDQIDNAIVNDIINSIDNRVIPTVPQSTSNTININGYSLTYDVTRLPNGNISVSTYYPGI